MSSHVDDMWNDETIDDMMVVIDLDRIIGLNGNEYKFTPEEKAIMAERKVKREIAKAESAVNAASLAESGEVKSAALKRKVAALKRKEAGIKRKTRGSPSLTEAGVSPSSNELMTATTKCKSSTEPMAGATNRQNICIQPKMVK